MCWVQCIHDGIISGVKILQRNLLPWKGRTHPDQWSHSLLWKITRDSFCAGITLRKIQKEEKCCFKFYFASQWHHTVSLNTGWTSMDMWRLDRGVRHIFDPWYWEHQVAITQNFHLLINSTQCLFILSVADLCSDCLVWPQLPYVTMPRAPL